jgi:phage gpG-like protein
MTTGVRVDGLREVARTLERAGVEASDLKEAFNRIGNIVTVEAKTLTPVLTGRLAASIRASKTKNKATVRAGGARVPYAGVIHYGGYNHITGTYFLTRAVDNEQDSVIDALENELQSLLDRLGLTN